MEGLLSTGPTPSSLYITPVSLSNPPLFLVVAVNYFIKSKQLSLETVVKRRGIYLRKAFRTILHTVSPECAYGFNEVPASDSTSEWAQNPN